MLQLVFHMPCIFLIVEDGWGADVELKVWPFFSVRACFRNNPDESRGITQRDLPSCPKFSQSSFTCLLPGRERLCLAYLNNRSYLERNGFLQWLWPLMSHRRVVNTPLNPIGVPRPCGYVVYISGFRSEAEIGWDCGPNAIYLLVDRFIGRRMGIAFSFHQRLNERK